MAAATGGKKDVKKETGLALKFKKVGWSTDVTLIAVLAPASPSIQSENFSDWYSSVITQSEMIDYYDISG